MKNWPVVPFVDEGYLCRPFEKGRMSKFVKVLITK